MFGLLEELWIVISTDNPATYYKLLQVSKVFKLDTDTMKAKFIKRIELKNVVINYRLPSGWLHSCDDQPAKICANGSQYWYSNGKKHRDNDQPAEICVDGTRRWYINGKLHRYHDQPAEICVDGTRRWYVNGKLHRDNGQPAEIRADGRQFWYIDGLYKPSI